MTRPRPVGLPASTQAPTTSPPASPPLVRCECRVCGVHTIAIIRDVPRASCRNCGAVGLSPVA